MAATTLAVFGWGLSVFCKNQTVMTDSLDAGHTVVCGHQAAVDVAGSALSATVDGCASLTYMFQMKCSLHGSVHGFPCLPPPLFLNVFLRGQFLGTHNCGFVHTR